MFRFWDLLLFAIERLWQHRVLVFWALVGLTAATTLALSLPLYVDAVNNGLLTSHLSEPPYAFRLRYVGSWEGNITRDDVNTASAVIETRFVPGIGLPLARQAYYVRAGTLTVLLEDRQPLGAFGLATLNLDEGLISVVAGQWPPEPRDEDDPLPVMLSEKMLYSMGVQVGDKLMASRPGTEPLTLEVVALWQAVNTSDPSWIFPPKFFDQIVLVQEDDLWKTAEGIERPVEEVAWFTIFDGRSVRTADVQPLIDRAGDAQREITSALPGVQMDLSPLDGLKDFSKEVRRLTQQLVIILLPVAGLLFYFVSLIAGLLVSRQQPEDSTLRSRGMSRGAILGLHVLMWLILAGSALGIGLVLSPPVVRLVGQTTSFLEFKNTSTVLNVTFTQTAVLAGALTGLIAASSGLYLAWRSSGQTINVFRQRAVRASKAWWQRMYLDIMLLVPAGYVLYTLWQQGGLVTAADDPFSDPLTFLGPTLFSLGLTLLFLRVWPFLLRVGAGMMSYGRTIALLMALRELTRSIGRYRGTLLMMCFTLSLTGFTASMASTIDRSLEDAVNYEIGADVVLVTAAEAQIEQQEAAEEGQQPTLTVAGYNTLPVSDLIDIDGIAQAVPVGHYSGRIVLPGQQVAGTIMGVDRSAMAGVSHFRSDYAPQPAADLFNLLAGNRNGALIDAATFQTYKLQLGQEITVQVSALGSWYDMQMPLVGVVNYFPTLDPGKGCFLITNLDPIFEAVGTQLPYNFWLKLVPTADKSAMRQQMQQRKFPVLEWQDAQIALNDARTAPSRRGVLGFLSVGFVASIVLTLVGTIIMSTASFRAQVTQIGSLRAMGLGSSTVSAYLILSQGMLASSGILGGTGIGLATTLLFLPLLDFSGGLPPYLVRVAWDEIALVYGVFAAILFGVTLLTTVMLGRERLAAIVKLGDLQ